MTLKETHEHVQNIIDDANYDYKSARNPKKKRILKRTIELFQSIKKHLKQLENETPLH
jgi:hypothetical protein